MLIRQSRPQIQAGNNDATDRKNTRGEVLPSPTRNVGSRGTLPLPEQASLIASSPSSLKGRHTRGKCGIQAGLFWRILWEFYPSRAQTSKEKTVFLGIRSSVLKVGGKIRAAGRADGTDRIRLQLRARQSRPAYTSTRARWRGRSDCLAHTPDGIGHGRVARTTTHLIDNSGAHPGNSSTTVQPLGDA